MKDLPGKLKASSKKVPSSTKNKKAKDLKEETHGGLTTKEMKSCGHECACGGSCGCHHG